MKLQGTLRRTLAMMLVLVFALSNMGLAEMVELVAEIPAAESSVEEPVVAEEAPEETEDAGDVKDVPDEEEPAAPDDSAEGEEEPDAEEEAAVAEAVSVVVQEIDETSLCAYETIEPEGAYEVSYMWERAESAEGEWEALEETSDVYSTDAEDRADYVYRCTVSVGELSATSEPVAFGAAEYADEAAIEEMNAEFELAQVNAETLTLTVKKESGNGVAFTSDNGAQVVLATADGAATPFTVEVANASEMPEETKYEWTIQSGLDYIAADGTDSTTDDETQKINVKKTSAITYEQHGKATVSVKAKKNETEIASGQIDLYVLPKLESNTEGLHVCVVELDGEHIRTDHKIGENELFKLGVCDSGHTKLYQLDDLYDITLVGRYNEAHDMLVEKGDGTWRYNYEKHGRQGKGADHNVLQLEADSTHTEITQVVNGAKKVKGLEDRDGRFNIVAYPKAIKLYDGKAGIDDIEKTITLVAGRDTTPENLKLQITKNDNGTLIDTPVLGTVWTNHITWKVENNTWSDTNDKQFVTFGDAETASGSNKIKQGTLTVPVTLSTESNLPSTPDGREVTITATGDCWLDDTATSTTPVTITWKIKVMAAEDAFTLSQDEIVLEPKEVGVPASSTDAKKDWATFTATTTNKKANDFGVTWAVVDGETHIEKDTDAATANVFYAKPVTSGYGTLFDGDKAKTGVEATVKATVNTGKATVTQTQKVILRPVATQVSLKAKGENTAWTPHEPSEGTASAKLPAGVSTTLVAGQSHPNLSDPETVYKSKITEIEILSVSEKGDETFVSAPTPDATTHEVIWEPSQAGTYKLIVKTDIGVKGTYTVQVQDLPDKLELKAARDIMYTNVSATGSDGGDKETLEIVATKGGKTDNVYTEGLTWTLSSEGGLSADSDYSTTIQKSTQTSAVDTTKHIFLREAADSSDIELHVVDFGTTTVPDGVKKGTLKIQVGYDENVSKLKSNTLSFTFKEKPDVPTSSLQEAWTIKNLNLAELDDANNNGKFDYSGSVETYTFAQDGSAESEIKLSVKDDLAKLEGYPIRFSVTPATTDANNDIPGTTGKKWNTATDAEIAKWIEVDEKTGAITVKPASTDKDTYNALSDKDESVTFTVSLAVEGTTIAVTRDIKVVSAPVKAVVKFVPKVQQDPAVFYEDIPYTLGYGDSIKLEGKLQGPEKTSPKGQYRETLDNPIALDKKETSGYTLVQDEDASKKKLDTWTLTAGDGNKATITTKDYANITTDLVINLKRNVNVPRATTTPATCSGSSNGEHVWQIIHVDEAHDASTAHSSVTTNNPDANSHYYVCRYCNAVSISGDSSKHTYTVRAKKDKDGVAYTDEMLWKGDSPTMKHSEIKEKYGDVVCDVCEFECPHTNVKSGSYQAVDGYYHTFVCADCGQTIKEVHDTSVNGECGKCHSSTAKPIFVNASGAAISEDTVVIGEDYQPRLEVEHIMRWSVVYSVDTTDGSDAYIQVVTNADGNQVVQGKKITTGTTKATLIATVTAEQDSFSNKTVTQKLPLVVKNKVTAPTIDSDQNDPADPTKAYIIDDGSVIKLTADPGVEQPELKDFVWGFANEDGTLKASSDLVQFMKLNPDEDATEANKYSEATGADLKGTTEIYLKVKASTSFNSKDSVIEYIYFGNNATKNPVACTKKLEVLAQLTNDIAASTPYPAFNKRVANAIAINGALRETAITSAFDDDTDTVKIAQGDSATVALKVEDEASKTTPKPLIDFDGRLGSVSFKVVADKKQDSGSETMSLGDVQKWAKIEDGKLVTLEKSDNNKLDASRKSITFLVEATVVLHKLAAGKTDEYETVVGYRRFEIVPAPASGSIQVEKKQSNGSTKFEDTTSYEVMEGDTFKIQAAVTAPGEKADGLQTIDPKTVKFTFPADVFELPDGQTEPTAEKGVYTLKVKKGVTASEFTITAETFGVTIAPLTVKVIRQFTDINVTATPTQIGAGEKPVTGGIVGTNEVTIKATGLPTEAVDDVDWKVYYEKTGEDGKPTGEPNLDDPVDAKVTNWTKTGTDNFKIKFSVADSRIDAKAVKTKGPGLVFVATAKKSTKGTTDNPVSGYAVVDLYNAPTNVNDAMALETEKSGTGSSLVLVAGERTLLTKHGYNADKGYGYTGGSAVEPEVISEMKDGQKAEANSVVTIEKDGDKRYIKAVGEGTATVAIRSYLWTSAAESANQLTLNVTVKAGVDSITRVESEKLPEPMEVSVKSTKTLKTNTFKAYRKVMANGQEVDEEVTDAWIELKDEKGLVTITRNASEWTITGVTPGTTELVACIGDVECPTKIPFTVNEKLEGVEFYNGAEKAGAQIRQLVGNTSAVTLTAKLNPLTATGDVEIVDPKTSENFKDEGFTYVISDDKDSVTITPPATGTGKIEFTARVANPEFKTGDTETLLHPKFLTAHVEVIVVDEEGSGGDEPGPDDPTIEIDSDIKIVGKTQIAEKETTELALVGIESDATVQWSASPSDAVEIEGSGLTAVVTGGSTAQTVTITATIGEKFLTRTIDVLSPIKATANNGITMSANEELRFYPLDGEFFEGYTTVDGDIGDDTSNLFTISYGKTNSNKYLTIEQKNGEFGCRLIGKAKTGKKSTQQASIIVKPYNGAAVEIPVTVTTPNKGFTLGGLEGTTVVMGANETRSIPITFNPSTATINLYAEVYSEEDEEYAGDAIVLDTRAKTLTTKDAKPGTYTVDVWAPGYDDDGYVSFNLEVSAPASEAEGLKLSLVKSGVNEKLEATGSTSVTMLKGEKLEASLVDDEGNTYSGATWTQSITKTKSQKVSLNNGLIKAVRTGKETVTVTAGTNTFTIEVTVKNAPNNSKVKLQPTATVRQVAFDEPFQLELALSGKTTYAGSGTAWNYIEWTGIAPDPVEGKPGWYAFSSEDYLTDETYTTSATLKTTWGYASKSVTFDVYGDYADALSLPETIELPATGKKTIELENIFDDEYANVTWKIGTKTLTTLNKSVKISGSKISAKLVSNYAVEITTKNASGTLDIAATAVADATNTVSRTATILPSGTAVMPEDAELELEKPIIGVGETIYLNVIYPTGKAPIGNVTFKAAPVTGKTKYASVSGNVLKGTKAGGEMEISVLLDGKATTIPTQKVRVIPKAKISYSQKPTRMVVGETLTIGVTIDGYDKDPKANLTAEQKALVDTQNIVTGITIKDRSMIDIVSIDPMPDEKLEETETNAHRYAVKLVALQAKKTSKGTYTSTKVTIAPQMGSKLSTNITVVDDDAVTYDGATVSFPDAIYIGAKETITLPVSTIVGSTNKSNVDWRFENPTEAAGLGLSFVSNGKLKADKDAKVGQTTNLIGTVQYGDEYDDEDIEPQSKIVPVTIGAKITSKDQFSVYMPKATIGLKEPVQAKVKFTNPKANASGKVTWASSKKAVATIDKNTGVITPKKAGKTKLTATVGGKKNTFELTVGNDMTGLHFTALEKNVDTTNTWTMWDYVALEGGALKADADKKADETAFWFDYTDNDILSDIDPRSGELSFIEGKTSGTALVTVHSYNDFSDTMLVVLGNGKTEGGSGENPPTPPVEQRVPDSIELYINGQKITDNNRTLRNVKEKQTITPTVYVRDALGVLIPDAEIEWTVSSAANATVDPATGVLTAVKTTKDKNTNEDKPVTVTATVKGTDKSESYSVYITAIMSEQHFGLKKSGQELADEVTLINKTTEEDLTFFIEDNLLTADEKSDATFNWKVESGNSTILSIGGSTKSGNHSAIANSNIDLEAKKEGTADLLITVTTGAGETKQTWTKTIKVTVSALPKSDDIGFTSEVPIVDGVMTLAAGESADVTVTLPEAYGTNPSMTPHAYQALSSSVTTDTATTDGSTVAKSTTPNVAANTFTVTAATGSAGTKFRVVVNAFETDDITDIKAEFTVKVVAAATTMDHVVVKSTPEAKIETKAAKIYAGVGETVNLSVELAEDYYWSQGLQWKKGATAATGTTTEETTGFNPTVDTQEAGKAVVSSAYPGTVELTIARKDALLTGTGAEIADGDNVNKTYTIVFLPVPVAGKTGTPSIKYQFKDGEKVKLDADTNPTNASNEKTGTTSETIILGEGERLSLTVDFGGAAAPTAYTNNVVWSDSTDGANISYGVANKTGRTMDIFGKAAFTAGQQYMSLYAKTESGVQLGELHIKVVAKPTDISLKSTDENGTATNNFVSAIKQQEYTGKLYYVKADIGTNTSSTLEMSCPINGVEIKRVEDVPNKNTWSISFDKLDIKSGSKTIPLVVRSRDQNLSKTFNLVVSTSTTEVLTGVPGVTAEVGVETPGEGAAQVVEEELPKGFIKGEGQGTTGGPEKVENFITNQTSVERSYNFDNSGIVPKMTITLSGSKDGLEKWTSSNSGQSSKGAVAWYLAVIDSGIPVESFAADGKAAEGKWFVALTQGTSAGTVTGGAGAFTQADLDEAMNFGASGKTACICAWFDLTNLTTKSVMHLWKAQATADVTSLDGNAWTNYLDIEFVYNLTA